MDCKTINMQNEAEKEEKTNRRTPDQTNGKYLARWYILIQLYQ